MAIYFFLILKILTGNKKKKNMDFQDNSLKETLSLSENQNLEYEDNFTINMDSEQTLFMIC